jgi:hypothetical protein
MTFLHVFPFNVSLATADLKLLAQAYVSESCCICDINSYSIHLPLPSFKKDSNILAYIYWVYEVPD